MEKNDYLDILKSTDLRPKKINIEDRRETILMEQDNEMPIHDKIKDWFRKNPNPDDEQIHDLADKWNIPEEELEKHIYMMLSDFIQKSDTKINENQEYFLQEIFVKANEIESMSPGPRRNMQILRLSIIAEFDAANLYEKFAELTDNMDIRKVMLEVANEEKAHVGEFEYLLEHIDPDHEENEDEGEDEVKDLTGLGDYPEEN